MNIDFNAAFEGGMTKKDVEEMLARQLEMAEQEYIKKKAAERVKEEEAKIAAQKASDKEALKAEARAYAINALLAYTEAFDLLPEGETMNEEDVAELEQLLIRVENMIPLYFKLFQMHDDLEADFGFGLGGLLK